MKEEEKTQSRLKFNKECQKFLSAQISKGLNYATQRHYVSP